MVFEYLLYEEQNRVATITLNRPEKLNALNDGLKHEIIAALAQAEGDNDVRCVLITGAGRAFSSGGDISAPSNGGARASRTLLDWLDHHQTSDAQYASIRDLSKPMIGVINGICYGAGLNLAVQCDFLIASDQARFCFVEARMGNSGQSHVAYHVGFQWAKRLFFTGEIIDARRAMAIGLVTEVLPHEQLSPKAQELGERIAAMPRMGVRFNKMTIDGVMHAMGLETAHRYYQAVTTITDYLSKDAEAPDGRSLREIREQEGLREFLRARNTFFDRPWP